MKALVSKTCPICGKEFEGKTNQKFCSQDCRIKHANANSQKYRAEYYKKNKEKLKAYSREHSNKPVELTEKTCPVCGKTFMGNKKEVYCSSECKTIGYKEKYDASVIRNRPTYEKVCPICGKTYTTTRPSSLCCSPECRKVDLREKQKEYQALPETKKRHSESSIRYQQKVKKLGMNMKEFNEFKDSGADVEAYLEERDKEAIRTCRVCGKEFISYNKINSTRTCPDCIKK